MLGAEGPLVGKAVATDDGRTYPYSRLLTSPTFLGGAPAGRRVQSYVVEANVPRVRIRVVGPASRIRYEAVVEAEHLADLPSPEGAPSADGFAFDLTAYPAR